MGDVICANCGGSGKRLGGDPFRTKKRPLVTCKTCKGLGRRPEQVFDREPVHGPQPIHGLRIGVPVEDLENRIYNPRQLDDGEFDD